jgi:hypothetical protein
VVIVCWPLNLSSSRKSTSCLAVVALGLKNQPLHHGRHSRLLRASPGCSNTQQASAPIPQVKNAHNILHTMATPIAESAILKPRDLSITSENDWPEFQLANVEVKEKNGDYFNLLLASNTIPVTVTGNLVLDKTQQHFCE